MNFLTNSCPALCDSQVPLMFLNKWIAGILRLIRLVWIFLVEAVHFREELISVQYMVSK